MVAQVEFRFYRLAVALDGATAGLFEPLPRAVLTKTSSVSPCMRKACPEAFNAAAL